MKTARFWITLLLCLAVVGGAVAASVWLMKTAPVTEAEDMSGGREGKVVQVIEVTPGAERISVTAYGTVIPKREVTMRAQVGGRILEHHAELVPGGRLLQGEVLLRIDPAEYELTLAEREAELEEAVFEGHIEAGRQVVASREWESLRGDLDEAEVNRDLVLRKPYLRRTEAMVEKAEAAIGRARLDLERTTLEVPFNAMVLEESIEVGQLVQSNGDLCRLVGTDAFWVQVSLPLESLRRVSLPEGTRAGSRVQIYLDGGGTSEAQWSGEVVRLLSDLETAGRMARIVVEVPDPLVRGEGGGIPLLLGSYVRVEIDAGRLEDVLAVPREALREGNRIWVADGSDQLQIRETEVLWTRRDTVLVSNVMKPEERLVVSRLKAALPGMELTPQLLERDGSDEIGAR